MKLLTLARATALCARTPPGLNIYITDRLCNNVIITRHNSNPTSSTTNSKTTTDLTSQVSGSRLITTESPFKNSGSLLKRIQYRFGVGDVNTFSLRRASVFHYEASTDKLDLESFFKHFHLPDTMFAFFRIVQLHVWMCQARSMMEGPEGRKLRNEIMERMWQDLDTRLQRMEVYAYSQRKKILDDLLFHHQAAMLSYDEGLLSDDKTLANALWRTLFSKEAVDPFVLEESVRYVRTQMNHLRTISPTDWCLSGKFTWAPFPPLINNRPSIKRGVK